MRKVIRLVIDKDGTTTGQHELSYLIIEGQRVFYFTPEGEDQKLAQFVPNAILLRWALEECKTAREAIARIKKFTATQFPMLTVTEWRLP